MKIESLASVSAIVRAGGDAARLYRDALGLNFEGGDGDYLFTEKLPGVKHFGLWPLRDAAAACFGSDEWPSDIPVPQASVEFEVEDVAAAAHELQQRGLYLIHAAKVEPWTQVIARLLSPDGLLIGVCYTPWFHEDNPRD